jgi:hypothetical protein
MLLLVPPLAVAALPLPPLALAPLPPVVTPGCSAGASEPVPHAALKIVSALAAANRRTRAPSTDDSGRRI